MISEKRTKALLEMTQKTRVLGLLPYSYAFSWCNNDCEFCCLKPIHTNKLMPLEKFKALGDCEINWLKNNIDKLPSDTLLKHYFIGGEIGVLPDEYFNYFYELFDSIYEITNSKKIKLDVTIFSNLMLNEKQMNRLFDLFDYILNKNEYVSMATSFDLTGRFNNELSLKFWEKNSKAIIDRKIPLLIEVVSRKSSMNKYINEKDSYIVKKFDELLEMDKQKQITVVLNEYKPYDSHSMNELATFEESSIFYTEIKNRHGTDLNTFLPYDINKESERDTYKAYCESNEFIPMFDKEEIPCEPISHIFWPENDKINKDDIFKNKLSGEFTCLKHPEKVDDFFNKTYNCLMCKYRPWCSKRNLRGCYQDHQFIWKDKNCIHKKLFEIVNDDE